MHQQTTTHNNNNTISSELKGKHKEKNEVNEIVKNNLLNFVGSLNKNFPQNTAKSKKKVESFLSNKIIELLDRNKNPYDKNMFYSHKKFEYKYKLYKIILKKDLIDIKELLKIENISFNTLNTQESITDAILILLNLYNSSVKSQFEGIINQFEDLLSNQSLLTNDYLITILNSYLEKKTHFNLDNYYFINSLFKDNTIFIIPTKELEIIAL